jgi:hypothetical protein
MQVATEQNDTKGQIIQNFDVPFIAFSGKFVEILTLNLQKNLEKL